MVFSKMRKLLYATFIVAMTFAIVSYPVSANVGAQYFTDVPPSEWYYEMVNASTQVKGFVQGYGDGTFRPEADVSRAEFVKMLLAATHLTPGGATANFLHEASSYLQSGKSLSDMDDHWLTVQGWTQIALDFGLLLPSDYPGGEFRPNQSTTRCEAVVMIVRTLGLVYPAQKTMEKELPFSDSESIDPLLRGYVAQAVEAKVLEGYPDGSFRGEKTISRAEAVAIIFRVLDYMETGIAPEIRAYAKEAQVSNSILTSNPQQIPISLSVPAQVIGGTVYLPARNVIAANATLYSSTLERVFWDTQSQQISITYTYPFKAGAGDSRYAWHSGPIDNYSETFPVPARLLYGEVMIPIYTPDVVNGIWGGVRWDAEAKTVVISMWDRGPIGS